MDVTLGPLCLAYFPVFAYQNVAFPIIPVFVQYRTFPFDGTEEAEFSIEISHL